MAFLSAPEGRRWKVLLGAAQLLLTVAVTWAVLDRVGWQLADLWALDARAWNPRWAFLLVSCALLLLGYVASAAIWARVVADLGGNRLPLSTASHVYFVSNLGRYLPGKLWQIAGLAVLAARHGIAAPLSTAAAVLGQAVALGGATLVGAASFMGWGAATSGPVLLAVLAVLAVALVVALVPSLQAKAMALWFRLARQEAPSVRPSVATTLRWLTLYTLNWMVYAGAFLFLVKGMGLSGHPVGVSSAFAAAYVLGYAAVFAPAGIGVREGFLVVFLSPHLGTAAALAVSVVARVWTTVVELVPAAVLWGLHLGGSRGAGPEASREASPTPAVPPPGVP